MRELHPRPLAVAELAGVVVLGAVVPLAVVAVAGGSAATGRLALAGGAACASGLALGSTARLLPSPARFVRRHYADLEAGRFAAAWARLPPDVQAQATPAGRDFTATFVEAVQLAATDPQQACAPK